MTAARIAAIRRFNRFYTRKIGVLHEGLLGGPLSLTEGRVIYEMAHRPATTASSLGAELGLDAGYLSRILRGFEAQGLIERRPSPEDARQTLLWLTNSGRQAFAAIDARSEAEIGALLARLPPHSQELLVQALGTAQALLEGASSKPNFTLRPPKPGDMGWIVHRQGALYAADYGWDTTFEALVAEIVAGFIRTQDPARERCWIAQSNGAVVGSVFLVRETDETAKLRLLYVEPSARGLGIGRALVETCITTARELGYVRLILWTSDVLTAARAIYQMVGFRLVARERHHSFGHELVGEHWELNLRA